jgi:Protein kinase domain
MRDSTITKQAVNWATTPLRYLPATLVSVFCLAMLLFSPIASHWSLPWFYAQFLKAKGPAPASTKVVIVSAEADQGRYEHESIAKLARSILLLRPKVLAVNLPSSLPRGPEPILDLPSQGSVVLAHGFHGLKSWAFSDAAVMAYPTMLSRSLYPLLDNPGQGLNLPMGDVMEMSDSLLNWPSPSTGFSWPLISQEGDLGSKQSLFSVPAFARLGRGVVASFGVEAVRRSLGVSAEKVRYLEGVGVLFNATHILPITAKGQMLLRFHEPGGIPRIRATDLLAGVIPQNEILGKIVFLDAVEAGTPGIKTVVGPLSATEIWAEAATGILDNTSVTSPSWGSFMAIVIGLILGSLIIAAIVLDLGLASVISLALFLACLYPVFALIVFLKSAWWLPPALPPLMVFACLLPFLASRILLSSPRLKNQSSNHRPIPPTPVFDPALATMTSKNQMPVRSTPIQTKPASPSPPVEARLSDPRDPPLIGTPPTAPVPSVSPAPEIERDAKGSLVRVGKYKIVRKMGFGSAGDVFEAIDMHMNRQVAIKTITKNATSHFDRAAERFVLEAKAAGSLNHPCINTVYDFGTAREVSYMVLEYLDGITLSQWMRNHPVPPRPQTVAHWIQQICSALDYAHGHKVIHRDLKPANLMVVNNGATIKLLDFGIAKMEDVGLTQTGMTVGTPSYMSPEQLSALKITPASDQYGMAVVIYQLLTYKLPYVGSKIPELCNRILKNDLIPITEFNPELGEKFWLALRKAMAKNPEDRYANCMEMYQTLEAAFPLGQPVSA